MADFVRKPPFLGDKNFHLQTLYTYTESTIYKYMTLYNVNISVKGNNLWIQVFVL